MNVDGYRFGGCDGVELAYRETGSGRPLILLLRGFGGAGSLEAWADAFVEQGRRVVLPDFRGQGTVRNRMIRRPIRRTSWPMTGSPWSSISDSATETTTLAVIRSAHGSCCACWCGAPSRAVRSLSGRG